MSTKPKNKPKTPKKSATNSSAEKNNYLAINESLDTLRLELQQRNVFGRRPLAPIKRLITLIDQTQKMLERGLIEPALFNMYEIGFHTLELNKSEPLSALLESPFDKRKANNPAPAQQARVKKAGRKDRVLAGFISFEKARKMAKPKEVYKHMNDFQNLLEAKGNTRSAEIDELIKEPWNTLRQRIRDIQKQ